MAPTDLAPFLGLGLFALVAFGGILALALFAFWLWMLVDCAQTPDSPASPNQRLIWILILVFTGWIGAIIYYFVERRARLDARRPPAIR